MESGTRLDPAVRPPSLSQDEEGLLLRRHDNTMGEEERRRSEGRNVVAIRSSSQASRRYYFYNFVLALASPSCLCCEWRRRNLQFSRMWWLWRRRKKQPLCGFLILPVGRAGEVGLAYLTDASGRSFSFLSLSLCLLSSQSIYQIPLPSAPPSPPLRCRVLLFFQAGEEEEETRFLRHSTAASPSNLPFFTHKKAVRTNATVISPKGSWPTTSPSSPSHACRWAFFSLITPLSLPSPSLSPLRANNFEVGKRKGRGGLFIGSPF